MSATEYFYPQSGSGLIGTKDEWTLSAGADKNTATRPGGGRTGPITHDADSSYVSWGGVAHYQTWGYQNLKLDWPGPVGTVSALTLGMRSRHGSVSGNTARSVYFINSSNVDGGAVAGIQDSSTSYADQGPSNGMSLRPGGGTWVGSDISATVIGAMIACYPDANSAAICYVTSVWGQITYDPPSGGFAFLLGIAGLLPVLGSLTDMAHFTRYLTWRRRYHPRHTILTGAEVERAWREIRAYRHPRFFFPAVA